MSTPPVSASGAPLGDGADGPQAESFSMHGPIHQHLLNGGLEKLNELGEQILAKRQESMPTIG